MKKILIILVLFSITAKAQDKPGIFIGKTINQIWNETVGRPKTAPFIAFTINFQIVLDGDTAIFSPDSSDKVEVIKQICDSQLMWIREEKKQKLIDLFLSWGFVQENDVFTLRELTIKEIPKHIGDKDVLYEMK